uniref:Uncharacterized protein n=1 Tax=Physcomitrium patens TaxID=3218 RepID=A0A2K1KVL4_PHYPA|nr:hypothetical protein PHYPA_004831 [Physcomitrium patens]
MDAISEIYWVRFFVQSISKSLFRVHPCMFGCSIPCMKLGPPSCHSYTTLSNNSILSSPIRDCFSSSVEGCPQSGALLCPSQFDAFRDKYLAGRMNRLPSEAIGQSVRYNHPQIHSLETVDFVRAGGGFNNHQQLNLSN